MAPPPADLSSCRCPAVWRGGLTVGVAGLLLARLFGLVERELSGKEVLFTLVIDGLLRKRRVMGRKKTQEEEEGWMRGTEVRIGQNQPPLTSLGSDVKGQLPESEVLV